MRGYPERIIGVVSARNTDPEPTMTTATPTERIHVSIDGERANIIGSISFDERHEHLRSLWLTRGKDGITGCHVDDVDALRDGVAGINKGRMPRATPCRLADGTWGARVPAEAPVSVGCEIMITARSGKTWTTTVSDIVEVRPDCVTVSTTSSRRRTSRRGMSDLRCWQGHSRPVCGCRDCHDTFDH